MESTSIREEHKVVWNTSLIDLDIDPFTECSCGNQLPCPIRAAYEKGLSDMSTTTEDELCFSFKWIGQPFSSCDECGHPFWEHSHERVMRNGRLFDKIIPTALKDTVRAKWGSPMESRVH